DILKKQSKDKRLREYAIHILQVIDNEIRIKKNKNIRIQKINFKKEGKICNDEKILRYAFGLARKFEGKRVVLITKDRNLRLKAFDYKNIEAVESSSDLKKR